MTTNRPRNIRHLHYIEMQLDPPRGNRISPSVAGDLEIVLWDEARAEFSRRTGTTNSQRHRAVHVAPSDSEQTAPTWA